MRTTDERQTTTWGPAGLAEVGHVDGPTMAPVTPGRRLATEERDARRALRRQILRLELRLADALTRDLVAGARGRFDRAVPAPDDAGAGPRLLDLGGLERRRDELVGRLAELEERRADERCNRALLAAMYRDPRAYRGVRLETADLAERGCRVYEVRPRFGLVGVLGGWWRVKVSSGCPLASAAPSAPHPPRATRPAPPTGGPGAARPASVSPAAGGPRTCAAGPRRW